jgi:hypothetical protein
VTCEHVAGANPRHHHPDGSKTCCKCGRDFEPVTEPTMARDPEFEQRILREASAKLGLEFVADALHRYADDRTMAGPVRMRDFVTEAAEEVADLANYLTWALQDMMASGDDDHEKRAALWESLQYAVLTYSALLRARS